MSGDRTAEPSPAIDTLRDRRAVLRGAAVVGLAGVSVPLLAACGDDGGTTSGTPSSAQSSSAPTSAPTSAASSAPTSSAPTSGGGGAVLGPVSDVPVGGGKIFTDAKIVVTQPTAGEYKGFTAVCTHQGCIVGTVENKTINCLCHQSKFNIADGSVAGGPAPSPLASVAVTVRGGNILGPA